MPRWAKITLGVVVGLIVLLVLNAIVVSNATKDGYVRNDGAQLIDTSNGTLQVLDQGDRSGQPDRADPLLHVLDVLVGRPRAAAGA